MSNVINDTDSLSMKTINVTVSQELEQQTPAKKERITSIDALRAVTLFGILLCHVMSMFGRGWVFLSSTIIGKLSHSFISFFLVGRCNAIFGILFGISFYLILRNPANTTKKFVWRCFLLFLIGMLNKTLYSYDALMWYGICGMVLACFRNLPVKKLWMSFIAVFVLNLTIRYTINLSDLIFGTEIPYNRYKDANGLKDVITYPIWMSAIDYLRVVINTPLSCLSKFLLGYCIAKSGIIENLKKYVTIKNFMVFLLLYAVLVLIKMKFHVSFFKDMGYMFGALSYAVLFLLLYYKLYPYFRFLEPYGKLGLTNYSMQGIIGVILTMLIFIPHHWSFELVLLTMTLFYIVQVVFSIVWLKKFKYGPYEWIWRCATEKKWIENRIR